MLQDLQEPLLQFISNCHSIGKSKDLIWSNFPCWRIYFVYYNTSTEKSPKTVPWQCARIGMNWTFKVLCLPTKPSQVAHLLSMEGTFNWETTSNMSWHFSWNVLVSNVCQHVRGVMVFEKLQKTHWCKNQEIFLQFRKEAYKRFPLSTLDQFYCTMQYCDDVWRQWCPLNVCELGCPTIHIFLNWATFS